MKVPAGMTVHAAGGPYTEGMDIPDAIVATFGPDHPLKAPRTETTASTARPKSKD